MVEDTWFIVLPSSLLSLQDYYLHDYYLQALYSQD